MRSFRSHACSGVVAAIALVVVSGVTSAAKAATWNGIEPLKSNREDVLRILGKPLGEGPDGELRFNVMGGTVLIGFVSEKFVTAKKLRPQFAGTVLQIVLEHERSSDTPESMGLLKNRAFVSEQGKGTSVFRNLKTGIIYTFFEGKLRTTRYIFSDDQLSRARR